MAAAIENKLSTIMKDVTRFRGVVVVFSQHLHKSWGNIIGVRAGGARGAAAPPKFGQLRFFGQHEKIWAKPVFKDVSMFLLLF